MLANYNSVPQTLSVKVIVYEPALNEPEFFASPVVNDLQASSRKPT